MYLKFEAVLRDTGFRFKFIVSSSSQKRALRQIIRETVRLEKCFCPLLADGWTWGIRSAVFSVKTAPFLVYLAERCHRDYKEIGETNFQFDWLLF